MLVLIAQDSVGGLKIRPPVAGEKRACNWLDTETTSGAFEGVEPWYPVIFFFVGDNTLSAVYSQ
jgi:isopenicillin N synthase-like dioxygenase